MKKIQEALELSEDLLKDLELSRINLQQVCLKCGRLARLLGEGRAVKWLECEISGFPFGADGKLTPDAHNLINTYSGRSYFDRVSNGHYVFIETLPEIESRVEAARLELSVARDPDVSVNSANPNQYVFSPMGNGIRRANLNKDIVDGSQKLTKIKLSFHRFVSDWNHKLKFENTIANIFESASEQATQLIERLSPEIKEILSSIHDNLNSENSTDWSNAVHNCRRAIYELSNILYPPSDEEIDTPKGKVKMTDDKYIMRLKQYVRSRSGSESFQALIGDNLEHFGARLDAIYKGTTKSSHVIVENKEEAERYVAYTFLFLDDLLRL